MKSWLSIESRLVRLRAQMCSWMAWMASVFNVMLRDVPLSSKTSWNRLVLQIVARGSSLLNMFIHCAWSKCKIQQITNSDVTRNFPGGGGGGGTVGPWVFVRGHYHFELTSPTPPPPQDKSPHLRKVIIFQRRSWQAKKITNHFCRGGTTVTILERHRNSQLSIFSSIS